ncbi:hypothetical protein GQ54DRAFT_146305 [Martensiomyces pterosporus]|nr:hypothetical protein GQ54DRAFT_146305 [Martensiomyces pterosporus]
MSLSDEASSDIAFKAGRDMGTLLDGFFSSIEGLRGNKGLPIQHDVNTTISGVSSGMWTPRVERQEDEDTIILRVHMPNSQIRIDTDTPGRLKIYGECNSQAAYESGGDRVTETQLGQFEKDIPLPRSASIEQMTAIFEGSDLVITIPKC